MECPRIVIRGILCGDDEADANLKKGSAFSSKE